MNTRSNKGFTLVEIMIVVVIIGLLAAMAIPAFQKVRTSSQDKAVLNNARQLSAAADQYYLENGVSTVASSNLIGATNYVKAINTVAKESYPAGFSQGETITIGAIAGARTVTYAP
jgi:type IV pilus assembly protein PilA